MDREGWLKSLSILLPILRRNFLSEIKKIIILVYTEFILVRLCRKLLAYRYTLESVPGTNHYWEISVKFLAQGNNGLPLTGFEPMRLALLKLLVHKKSFCEEKERYHYYGQTGKLYFFDHMTNEILPSHLNALLTRDTRFHARSLSLFIIYLLCICTYLHEE